MKAFLERSKQRFRQFFDRLLHCELFFIFGEQTWDVNCSSGNDIVNPSSIIAGGGFLGGRVSVAIASGMSCFVAF